ncbi:hypothetical protein HanXRQr2_Chr04g0164331 [Helianthus annuus]|uniref:Uncharacterized protein n=1 Tax=Helianthus annuus TaxID=4232 RepID=A0A251UZS7_HELAN|nr:hypothetical protein HanXRQr2_Chr04g0164331 [Helianthus annuus]KAJ0931158.1 hypothetical protein HanPSC8_Chr04g0158261 [Helianthus annuus]
MSCSDPAWVSHQGNERIRKMAGKCDLEAPDEGHVSPRSIVMAVARNSRCL